jgi:hypothetical protein
MKSADELESYIEDIRLTGGINLPTYKMDTQKIKELDSRPILKEIKKYKLEHDITDCVPGLRRKSDKFLENYFRKLKS